jgi:large subunit ribosomal protein L4
VNVKILSAAGELSGDIALDDAIFAAKVNVPLMHQVVTAQLAAARAGTHSTKTRGEVRGGGAKPWRQKGTGRARHGSTREPQWKGGGTVFGPKPRDYAQHVPKKMKAAALRSALSVRAKDGKLLVVDGLSFDKPRTKDAIAALTAWGIEGKVLLVLTLDDRNVAYAFRNLPNVHVIAEQQLNTYDVINADTVVFVRAAIEAFQSRTGDGAKVEAPAQNQAADTTEAPAPTTQATETTQAPAPSTSATETTEAPETAQGGGTP